MEEVARRRHAGRRGGNGVRGVAPLVLALGLVLALALAACGTTTAQLPQQPSGTYTNATYHVRINYPAGWKVTTLPGGSTAVPLTITITHISTAPTESAFPSTFTLTVIDTTSPDEATPAAQLKQQIAAHTTLTPITLSGQPAYQDAPQQKTLANSGVTITHTDYYLLAGTYEYALTTDAVSSDSGADAALQGMVRSFTLLP